VTQFRFEAEAAVSFDVEAAFEWYETENSGLGFEFLNQLRRSYLRILENPLAYQELRHGIRRALTRQFPYAIYFSIEGEIILILAVLHTARNPAEWQKRV
jgi:plasmid stabilization system protein ParE